MLAGAYVALLLIGVFAISGPRAGGSEWFQRGSADATRMLAGEWWRAATALNELARRRAAPARQRRGRGTARDGGVPAARRGRRARPPAAGRRRWQRPHRRRPSRRPRLRRSVDGHLRRPRHPGRVARRDAGPRALEIENMVDRRRGQPGLPRAPRPARARRPTSSLTCSVCSPAERSGRSARSASAGTLPAPVQWLLVTATGAAVAVAWRAAF